MKWSVIFTRLRNESQVGDNKDFGRGCLVWPHLNGLCRLLVAVKLSSGGVVHV